MISAPNQHVNVKRKNNSLLLILPIELVYFNRNIKTSPTITPEDKTFEILYRSNVPEKYKPNAMASKTIKNINIDFTDKLRIKPELIMLVKTRNFTDL
jgi:hypothetical protein